MRNHAVIQVQLAVIQVQLAVIQVQLAVIQVQLAVIQVQLAPMSENYLEIIPTISIMHYNSSTVALTSESYREIML